MNQSCTAKRLWHEEVVFWWQWELADTRSTGQEIAKHFGAKSAYNKAERFPLSSQLNPSSETVNCLSCAFHNVWAPQVFPRYWRTQFGEILSILGCCAKLHAAHLQFCMSRTFKQGHLLPLERVLATLPWFINKLWSNHPMGTQGPHVRPQGKLTLLLAGPKWYVGNEGWRAAQKAPCHCHWLMLLNPVGNCLASGCSRFSCLQIGLGVCLKSKAKHNSQAQANSYTQGDQTVIAQLTSVELIDNC